MQDELLGTLCTRFFEGERDACEFLWAHRRLAGRFECQKRQPASPAFLLTSAQTRLDVPSLPM